MGRRDPRVPNEDSRVKISAPIDSDEFLKPPYTQSIKKNRSSIDDPTDIPSNDIFNPPKITEETPLKPPPGYDPFPSPPPEPNIPSSNEPLQEALPESYPQISRDVAVKKMISKTIEDLNDKHNKTVRDIIKNYTHTSDAERKQYEVEKDKLRNQVRDLNMEVTNLRGQVDELKGENRMMKSMESRHALFTEEAKKESDRLKSEIEKHKQVQNDFEIKILDLTNNLGGKSADVEILKNLEIEMRAKIEQYQKMYERAVQDRDYNKKLLESSEEKKAKAERENFDLSNDNTVLHEDIKRLKQASQMGEKNIAQLNEELKSVTAQLEKLKVEYSNCFQSHEKSKLHLRTLEEREKSLIKDIHIYAEKAKNCEDYVIEIQKLKSLLEASKEELEMFKSENMFLKQEDLKHCEEISGLNNNRKTVENELFGLINDNQRLKDSLMHIKKEFNSPPNLPRSHYANPQLIYNSKISLDEVTGAKMVHRNEEINRTSINHPLNTSYQTRPEISCINYNDESEKNKYLYVTHPVVGSGLLSTDHIDKSVTMEGQSNSPPKKKRGEAAEGQMEENNTSQKLDYFDEKFDYSQDGSIEQQMMLLNFERNAIQSQLNRYPCGSHGRSKAEIEKRNSLERTLESIDYTLNKLRSFRKKK